MDANVRQDGDALVFGGALDRAAVVRLWPQLQAAPASTARLDLTAVDVVDSAGLALLVDLRARLPPATVVGPPPGLAELRAAYRLDEALAFAA